MQEQDEVENTANAVEVTAEVLPESATPTDIKQAGEVIMSIFVKNAATAANTIAELTKKPSRHAIAQLNAAKEIIDRIKGTVTASQHQTNIQVIIPENVVMALAKRWRIPEDKDLTIEGEVIEVEVK